ncbi:hypothetical protein RRSWK_01075 [Rhodopirellula sp. SWK7]|nr:hypothetical protein RRSWK_01075 [Rhodopirellula sp. SWK7]
MPAQQPLDTNDRNDGAGYTSGSSATPTVGRRGPEDSPSSTTNSALYQGVKQR